MRDKTDGGRAAAITSLRAKLERGMADLDRREAEIDQSFRRLAAAAAGHAISQRVVEMIIADSRRTGQPHGLPYTEESLSTDRQATEWDLRRAARLLENAKREIALARAQGREVERELAALEAEKRPGAGGTVSRRHAAKLTQSRRRRRRR